MLTDSVTAHTLLLAIGGFVVLLAALLLWTRRRGLDLGAPAPASGERRDVGRSLAGLLQVRLLDGVEASVDYAHGYETQIVDQIGDEIAAADEAEHDDLEHQQEERRRMTELHDALQFVRAYRSDSARDLAPGEEVRAFFSGLAAREEAERVPPVHRALLNLAESSKAGSLQLVMAALLRHHGTFQGIKSHHRLMQATLSVMERLAELARRAKERLEGPRLVRRQAVAEIERELVSLGNELDGAARTTAGEGDQVKPPELLFVEDRVRELIEIVRREASELADRPDFQVELQHQGDSIEVESENLFLTFTVGDRRKVKEVSKVTVFPILHSKDLTYNGFSRALDLKNGQADVQFMFRAFIFSSAAFDSQPRITFNIHYIFLDQDETVVRDLQLPILRPAPRVMNPFTEGKIGSGLSGTSQLFVGRETLLREIAEDLLGGMGSASLPPSALKAPAERDASRAPQYYLIHGLSRSGKSSVLNQLVENPIWLKDRYVPIKVSAKVTQDTKTFFRDLYEYLKDELQEPLGRSVKPVDQHFFEASPYWRMVTELLRSNTAGIKSRHLRVLFLIDEYQKLVAWDSFKDDKQDLGTGYYQFPEFIKVLRDRYGDLAAVLLAGEETLQRLAHSGHFHWIQQLGGRLTSREITNLAPREADRLILQGFEQYDLTIDAALLARVRAYTACHPFLHMLMGYFIFEQLKDGKILRAAKVVMREDVDRAALRVEGELMKFIWSDPWIQGPGQEESRIFLAALAAISYDHGSERGDLTQVPEVSIGKIQDYLFRNSALDHDTFRFEFAPAHLCAYGVISLVKEPPDARYQLTYPLFAIWAARYQWLQREVGTWRQREVGRLRSPAETAS